MLLFSLLMACDSGSPATPSPLSASTPNTVQLVYSGNVHGEIEPCG